MEALRARGVVLQEHHEQNASIAQQLGVPAAAIFVIHTPAWSTLTEAQAVLDYLQQHGWYSILLVTSKAHARRARMTFRTFAGSSLQIAV